MNLIFISVFFLLLCYQACILNYVINLKNCNCEKNWKLSYIKYWSIFSFCVISLRLIQQIISMYRSQSGGANTGNMIILGLFLLFLGFIIFHYYTIFSHLKEMDKNKCECEKTLRKIIYYSTISLISLTIIGGISFKIYLSRNKPDTSYINQIIRNS